MLAGRASGRADGTFPDRESSLISNSTGSPSARLRKPSARMLRWCTNTCERRKSKPGRATQEQAWEVTARRGLGARGGARASQATRSARVPRVPRPSPTRPTHIALLVVNRDEAKALLDIEPLARPCHEVARPRAEAAQRREHGRLARPHRERLHHRRRLRRERHFCRGCERGLIPADDVSSA